jgi:hypothetical protein
MRAVGTALSCSTSWSSAVCHVATAASDGSPPRTGPFVSRVGEEPKPRADPVPTGAELTASG